MSEPLRSNRRRFLKKAGVSVVMLSGLSASVSATQQSEGPDPNSYPDILDAMDGDGSEENPFTITTLEELQAVDGALDGFFELDGDIDASATAEWNGGEGFTPIGDGNTDGEAFTGVLDGRDYTITDLHINRTTDFIGLFSDVLGTLKNIHLESVTVSGDSNVGGLSGRLEDGAIEESSITGTVAGDVQGRGNGSNVGGLLGTNVDGTVSRSSADAEVSGEGRYVGGLVGYNRGKIAESFADGDIYGTERIQIQDLGGLVGHTRREVVDCYATATVHRHTEQAGGLVGLNTGEVRTSYAIGEAAAGLIGNNTGTSPEVSDSYWDVDASGTTHSDQGEALETSEMQGSEAETNLEGFDFESTWQTTDGYPQLAWEASTSSSDNGGLSTNQWLGLFAAIGGGLYFWSKQNKQGDAGE